MRGQLTEGADIDLGLAVSALSLTHGETRTSQDLADFCGCTRQMIETIEKKALRKLFSAHFIRHEPAMQELHDHYLSPPALRSLPPAFSLS